MSIVYMIFTHFDQSFYIMIVYNNNTCECNFFKNSFTLHCLYLDRLQILPSSSHYIDTTSTFTRPGGILKYILLLTPFILCEEHPVVSTTTEDIWYWFKTNIGLMRKRIKIFSSVMSYLTLHHPIPLGAQYKSTYQV